MTNAKPVASPVAAVLCDRGPDVPYTSKLPWHRRDERIMNGYDQPILVCGNRFAEQRAITFRVNNWQPRCDALDAAVAEVARVEKQGDTVDALLVEWLAAEENATVGHYQRFPESHGVALPDCSDEIKADWYSVSDRRDTATRALVKHIKALRERLST